MQHKILEILLNKFIDGELTANEKQLLEAELEQNPVAGQLLDELRQLHNRSTEAVTCGVLKQGESFNDIFDSAHGRQFENMATGRKKDRGRLRFASGLAAGFLIALTIQIFITNRPAAQLPPPLPVSNKIEPAPIGPEVITPLNQLRRPGRVLPDVQFYHFTDEAGNQWLLDGYRNISVIPAVYNSDL